MPRSNDDSWGLASSVGVTATIVATSRALAAQGPEPLLDDPYAEPLVRAVGLAASLRILDGETSPEDDPMLNRKTRTEQMLVWTRFFDDFFTGATGAGIGQAVILASGLDTRAYRLGWPAGTVVYEIDQPQVIEFKTSTLADLGATPNAEHRRSASICATTGRPLCGPVVSTSISRPPGAPRDYCPTCRPRPRTDYSTTSPRSAHQAASWPPNTSPIRPPPTKARSASLSGGNARVSISTRPICSIKANATSWATTSPATAGR